MNKKALNLSVELYPFPGLQTHARAVSESKATGTPSTRHEVERRKQRGKQQHMKLPRRI